MEKLAADAPTLIMHLKNDLTYLHLYKLTLMCTNTLFCYLKALLEVTLDHLAPFMHATMDKTYIGITLHV